MDPTQRDSTIYLVKERASEPGYTWREQYTRHIFQTSEVLI
jgi:hypothetical protein